MRGLPFPSDALFSREQSYDFPSLGPNGSSSSDIPVARGSLLCPVPGADTGIPFYPGTFPPVNGVNGHGHVVESDAGAAARASRSLSPSYALHPYAQGPQGDPFAPHPSAHPHFLPDPAVRATTEPTPSAAKFMKRRRKPRREEDCGFCGGNDEKNKENAPERMVTCNDCGRSGHPSCMELGEIGETLRSYQWKCVECKNCEICQEKGDDERILICDNCDRGWHMDCLSPPLEENPEGSWFCPLCQPAPDALVASTAATCIQYREPYSVGEMPPQSLSIDAELQIDPALQSDKDIDPALRAVSDADVFQAEGVRLSARQIQRSNTKPNDGDVRDRKGKSRAVEHGFEEEVEAGIDDDDEELFPARLSTSRSTGNKCERRRSRGRPRHRARSESITGDITSSAMLRPPKRTKHDAFSQSLSSRQQKSSGTAHPKVVVRLRLPSSKGKGKAREEEENEEQKKGLFDDILSLEDRDTSKTAVVSSDKERFEKARQTAESKLLPQAQVDSVDLLSTPGPSGGRFPLRSTVHQLQQIQAQHSTSSTAPASPSPSTPGPSYFAKNDTNTLRIRTIRFGPHDIQTWFDAPFPEEFSNIPDGRLWICEFCLKYMKSRFGAQRHRLKCKSRHPPGDEIYRDGNVSVFEVDGRKNKIYCQNLCLLSKMFLDHKSLFYDVEPFLFYVMTEVDDIGARFVGYFSKEKRSLKDLNLSCIMTLPVRQRQGWGNLLIDFSYLLSKKEQKNGTPERPLSALGAIGYKKYWTLAIMRYLRNSPSNPRLEEISAATAMNLEDICSTLTQLNMISIHESPKSPIRPSPGRSVKMNRARKNGIARRNLQKIPPKDEDKATNTPFTPPSSYEVHWSAGEVERFLAEWESKGYLVLKPEKLKWTPFLVSRADMKSYEAKDQMVNVESTPAPATSDTASSAAVIINTPGDSIANYRRDSVGISSEPFDQVDETKRADGRDIDLSRNQNGESGRFERTETGDVNTATVASPSPIRMPQSRTINGLEALAAVAYAVSKANPLSLRKKPSNNESQNDLSKHSWLSSTMSSAAAAAAPPLPRSNSDKRTQEYDMQTLQKPSTLRLTSRESARGHPSDSQTSILSQRTVASEIKEELIPLSDLRESVEKDAELAARLAREEGAKRRSLRSSTNNNFSISVTPARSVRESNSKQKDFNRKRAKPSPGRDSPPSTPFLLDRRTTRRQNQSQGHVLGLEFGDDSPTKTSTSRATRQSSRLAGNTGANESPMGLHMHTQTSGIRSSAAQRNGGQSPRHAAAVAEELPSPSQARSSYTRSEDRRISTHSNEDVVSATSSASLSTPILDISGDAVMEDELVDIDAEGEEIDMDVEPHGAYAHVHEAAVVVSPVEVGVGMSVDNGDNHHLHHDLSVKMQNGYGRAHTFAHAAHAEPEKFADAAAVPTSIIKYDFDANKMAHRSPPGDGDGDHETKVTLNGQRVMHMNPLCAGIEEKTELETRIASGEANSPLQRLNCSSPFQQTVCGVAGAGIDFPTNDLLGEDDMDAEGEVDEDAVGELDPGVYC